MEYPALDRLESLVTGLNRMGSDLSTKLAELSDTTASGTGDSGLVVVQARSDGAIIDVQLSSRAMRLPQRTSPRNSTRPPSEPSRRLPQQPGNESDRYWNPRPSTRTIGQATVSIDHAIEYAETLAVFLPDEQVLAATVTCLAPGITPGPPPSPPKEPKKDEFRWWTIPLFLLILIEYTPSSPDWLYWLTFGRAAKGDPHSIAARVYWKLTSIPFEKSEKSATHEQLVVVTRRWVYFFDVLDTPGWFFTFPEFREPPEKRLKPRYRLDRLEIRTATAGRYRLNPGRLVLHFVDGSWVAFASMTYMGRARAKRVAQALQNGL